MKQALGWKWADADGNSISARRHYACARLCTGGREVELDPGEMRELAEYLMQTAAAIDGEPWAIVWTVDDLGLSKK